MRVSAVWQLPTIWSDTYQKVYIESVKLNECPVTETLKFIGGKWKPIILFSLMDGAMRSGELARQIPQASGKMLTQQLRELEKDGIIKRTIYKQVPPKVEYALAARGESLRPVLRAMCKWGEANQSSR